MSGKKLGRPAGTTYDTGFVRDISLQILIAFYNERQATLRDRIMKDAEYVGKIRTKAAGFDPVVRHWLQVIDEVPPNSPRYRFELMFHAYCLALEPPQSREFLDANPEREAYLRGYLGKHLTEEQYRIYYSRFYDAIQRVRTDSCLTLNVPFMMASDDEEDDFL